MVRQAWILFVVWSASAGTAGYEPSRTATTSTVSVSVSLRLSICTTPLEIGACCRTTQWAALLRGCAPAIRHVMQRATGDAAVGAACSDAVFGLVRCAASGAGGAVPGLRRGPVPALGARWPPYPPSTTIPGGGGCGGIWYSSVYW